MRAEVVSNLTQPTDAEGGKFYQENKEKIQGDASFGKSADRGVSATAAGKQASVRFGTAASGRRQYSGISETTGAPNSSYYH